MPYKMFTDFSIDTILQTEKENLIKPRTTVYPTRPQYLSLDSFKEQLKHSAKTQNSVCLFEETFLQCLNGKQSLKERNFKAPFLFDYSSHASSMPCITGRL